MSFEDHFSAQAAAYARYRPTYPDALFAWLAEVAPARDTAWDCGTGSAQAAVGLAAHFKRVIATDQSRRQLDHAPAHPRIDYRQVPAEASLLDTASVDLVTVAQAIHWFDLGQFYAEARRVLKPGGVIAVKPGGVIAAWTYTLLDAGAGIGELLGDFYRNVVGPYWPAERRMVDDRYRTLPFPFAPIEAPAFDILTEWSRDELLGYLGTWSATQAYMHSKGEDPLIAFAARLRPLWPDPARKKTLRWPLHLRVGRV